MLYGCGGSDVDIQLEGPLEDAVKALGVDKNQVRYTVMYSMSASDKEFQKTYRGEKGKTYRYELSKDTDLTQAGYHSKYFYKNASEVELYKSSTLSDFIKWSVETAPAEHYIIEFMNHVVGLINALNQEPDDFEKAALADAAVYRTSASNRRSADDTAWDLFWLD